jgi:predicted DNA-binding antitoxin AbrB/MazE fold protein
MSKKKRKRLRGKVQKVLKPIVSLEPEKAQISVDEADELYREIRVENVLTDENGEKVRLKPGAEVDVILEADTDATTKKSD